MPLTANELARADYLSCMPLARIGVPDDVAGFVCFLLSDEARWIAGQVVGVDGSHTIRRGPMLVDVFRQFMPDER